MTSAAEGDLVALGQRYLYPNYRQPPFVLSHGQGSWVWDTSGKRYLDFYAGIAVSVLGHAHPALAAALADQATKLLHVSNYFFNEPNVRLAERVCRLSGLDRAFFCNSGTEAIEASLKLARRHFFSQGQTERVRVIAFHNSFHGRTLGALAATGQNKYKEGFGTLPHTTHVAYGDVDAVRSALGPDVAAILVEPVQGEGGVLPAPPQFLPQLRRLADEHGALLIADEIQTGVGRTGAFLASSLDDVKPDVVALAKGLGGGVPIGAMLCREGLSQALPPGSHGSTFGGNPLASRAALTVLEVLEQDGLVNAARSLGDRLAAGLRGLATRYPTKVSTARGRGLLQALVLADGVDARGVMTTLQNEGLMVTIAGAQALRYSPPLVVTAEEIDEALAITERVLKAS